VQIDSIALVLRPRSTWEGCDLGVRLLQSWFQPVYLCYLSLALPLFLVMLAAYAVAAWLPALLIWISKPWLDRTILFVLSRAMFGESTTPADVWDARHSVWWSRIGWTLVLSRLSASRSFKQPVLQLEGLSGRELHERVRTLTLRHRGVARMATTAFAAAEIAFWASLLGLQLWLAPHAFGIERQSLFGMLAAAGGLFATVAYAAAVAFVEPFYVAAGFGLYLNRRVELEAWDIEQEFRRAFAT
jgi:hypothetical protein